MTAILFTAVLLCLHCTFAVAQRGPAPRVPWRDQAVFTYDREVSDDFRGDSLDETKWDTHGLRNVDTGCPTWNGPPSTDAPEFSTFYPTPTDPDTGAKIHQQFSVSRGKLWLEVNEEPLSYFQAREYYCDSTTFKCNHNENIDCFATNFFGEPVYTDETKTQYKAVIHDKCKIEPFCIPHPEIITGKPRVYKKYTAAHLVGKKAFKYGYVETKARLPNSPMLAAVWMHNDELVNGYCRYRTDPVVNGRILECPSAIRSRRWQEIDVLEAMNTPLFKRLYIPNIHTMAMYKGEFTSKTAVDTGDGLMGGGPIIVKKSVFSERIPDFSGVPESEKIGNEFHYSSGSVHSLDADWARKARTLGMYWSPNEIRFYFDGQEVRRIKNTLIHQPMFLDISSGWNVPWGKEEPRSVHLRRKAKIFYVRRWEVFTEGGVDPPSNLTLDTKMERTFNPRYGDQMGGVHGLLPQMDDRTVLQPIPENDIIVAAPGTVNADLGTVMRGARRPVANSTDYLLEHDPVAIRMRRRNKKLKRAGGSGNLRFSRKRQRMDSQERRNALGRPDRSAIVSKPGAMPKPVKDAAITVFDFRDPNKEGAGWATKNGDGRELGSA